VARRSDTTTDCLAHRPWAAWSLARWQADAVQRDAVALSAELLALLTADTVNQENVCCLNTSLIFFLLARRRGEMLAHLEVGCGGHRKGAMEYITTDTARLLGSARPAVQAVAVYDAEQQRVGERRPLPLRENLRQLLHFWYGLGAPPNLMRCLRCRSPANLSALHAHLTCR